jgi:phospholipid/cholesterol/gamma-HCH transport system substrate-binding protein
MPRTRSLAWSELKLGVLAIVAIVIAALTIFLVTGGRGFFWQRYSLKARFSSVPGLKPGSPVRLAGVEVGSVTAVTPVDEMVDVEFEVHRKWQPRITTASFARLGSVSLLGESAVDITPSVQGTPIPPWGYVPQGRPTAVLADMTDQASQGITELTAAIRDMRTGRGTIGKLMADEQLYMELHRFVRTAADLTEGLKAGQGSLGRLMKDRQTADALEAALKHIEQVTARLNAGEGSLGKLLKDDAFLSSLASATSKMDLLVSKLNSSEGTAGKFINDPALFNRLTGVTEQLEQLVTRLTEGEGTAGLLLKDKQLYENMNGAVGDLRTLLANIQRDPRRYLNVRVSIW